jgi:hypothetical protein
MDIADKAETARAVVRVGESAGVRYRLNDTELTDSTAIGDAEAFPQFGEFLDVSAVDVDGNALGRRWLECPGDLAKGLVDLGISDGETFAVEDASKTDDGAWSIEVSND